MSVEGYAKCNLFKQRNDGVRGYRARKCSMMAIARQKQALKQARCQQEAGNNGNKWQCNRQQCCHAKHGTTGGKAMGENGGERCAEAAGTRLLSCV
jgi:hypothetical protein